MTVERATEVIQHVVEEPVRARSLLEEALAVLVADLRMRLAELELKGKRQKK